MTVDMEKTIEGFSVKSILYLLCGAWEGGSNYWIDSVDFKRWKDETDEKQDPYFPKFQLAPFRDDSELKVHVHVGLRTEQHVLNLEKIKQGLVLMRENHTRHYDDWCRENDDAETSDVFLQLCLFKSIQFS